mmetsp:Transcript_36259/g.58214  ORF Transcript_36259/g.58214 Transcript_36259/m.58214 type:complete len:306 (+) Transcript_36259:71-988(+)
MLQLKVGKLCKPGLPVLFATILAMSMPLVGGLQNIEHEVLNTLEGSSPSGVFSSPESVMNERGVEPARCRLLSSAFDYLIQGILGFSAFATLWIKFKFENTERDIRSFVFDTTKQAVSGVTIHFFNIFLAKLLIWGGGTTKADECDVYFVNFCVDIFFGVVLVWLLLKPYEKAVQRYQLSSRQCGHYGEPNEWSPFFLQLIGFSFLMVAVKLILSACEFVLAPQIDQLGHAMFFWMDPNPKLKLVMIMIVAPFLCNVMFFWVVDQLISNREVKKNTSSSDVEVETTHYMKSGQKLFRDEPPNVVM